MEFHVTVSRRSPSSRYSLSATILLFTNPPFYSFTNGGRYPIMVHRLPGLYYMRLASFFPQYHSSSYHLRPGVHAKPMGGFPTRCRFPFLNPRRRLVSLINPPLLFFSMGPYGLLVSFLPTPSKRKLGRVKGKAPLPPPTAFLTPGSSSPKR